MRPGPRAPSGRFRFKRLGVGDTDGKRSRGAGSTEIWRETVPDGDGGTKTRIIGRFG